MKVERLKKSELNKYCKKLGIETKNKKKCDLVEAVYLHQRAEIDIAIKSNNDLGLAEKLRLRVTRKNPQNFE